MVKISNLERYSISKISEDTFTLTDAHTLQTWQIEILRNAIQKGDEEQIDPDSISKNSA